MRFVSGYMDTRTNKEDFALTPYLFSVYNYGVIVKIFGIGLCWGYHSAYIGIGFGVPKNFPFFRAHKFKKDTL